MTPTILPPDEVLAGRRAFGVRLRELREAAGLSQEALANTAGLDRKTVNRIEGGVNGPLLDQILLLAAALDQAPYELFRWPGVNRA